MTSRIKATFRHLVLTLVVLGAATGVVMLVWYPSPYFEILDARKYLLWMFGLTLGLGPFLTLVLFKPGKKGLKGDLIVVGLLQLAAIGFTGWKLYSERPHYMIFAVDRFNLFRQRDVVINPETDSRLLDKPVVGPMRLVATMPTDPGERSTLTLEVFEGKPNMEQRSRYWTLYSEDFAKVAAPARTLQSLMQARPFEADALGQVAASSGVPMERLAYWPVIGRSTDFAVILDRRDGSIIDAVAVDPWLE